MPGRKVVEERSISVRQETYERLALLRARLSARVGKKLAWDESLQIILERERERKEVISWLYTLGIFVAITWFLLWPVYIFMPSLIPWIFILGAVVAAIYAYVLSPFSVRMMKPFKEAPQEIVESLERLSRKAGFKKTPVLKIAETPEINAMAYSSPSGGGVCLTRGLIEVCNSGRISCEELQAIIGHEIGHLKNKDTLKRGLALSWIIVFDYFGDELIRIGIITARIGTTLGEETEEEIEEKTGFWGMLIVIYGWFAVIAGSLAKLVAKWASLLALHLSRGQEYAADDMAAELTHPRVMASAMEKLEALNNEFIAKELAQLPHADQWQVQPRNPTWVDSLWDTHPPSDKRIARQRALEAFL